MNGDGLPDIVQSQAIWNGVSAYVSSATVYYNNGSDWVYSAAASGTLPVNSISGSGGFTIGSSNGNTVFVDVNGDGLPDLLSSGLAGGNPATWLNNGPTADLLKKMTYRTGKAHPVVPG